MFSQQFKALLVKQWIIKRVRWKNTLAELLFPIIFGCLSGIQGAMINQELPPGKEEDFQMEMQRQFQQQISPFIISSQLGCACFASSAAFIINVIVSEKETKMRESLRIMSMQRLPYALSFIVSQSIINIYTATVFTYSFISFWEQEDQFSASAMWISTFMFGTSLLALAMFLSTFFTDSKMAGQLGNFLMYMPTSIFLFAICEHLYRVFDNDFQPQFLWIQFGYFMPQWSYSMIMMQLMVPGYIMEYMGYQVFWAWFSLIASIVVFFAAYLYLDAVMPNTYGISQSPCFCLEKKKRHSSLDQQDFNQIQHSTSSSGSGSERDFSQSDDKVKIMLLTKKFGNFTALDNCTLDIEPGQVCCLLGHNGAGKTTLINVLTGMLQPTRGEAFIFGNSLIKETIACQRDIGLCQQFDVLFRELTPLEHMQLVCDLKGLSKEQAYSEIEQTLEIVMLSEHRHKKSHQLSGGMKRKLSLGMALVGSSKLIILDEPTSGLDADARRQIWDVILRIKQQQKSIILSTQHIEEADVLGDRVCVLSRGKKIVFDTAENIKRRFGVGYNLIIETKNEQFKLPYSEITEVLSKTGITHTVKEKDEERGRIQVQIPFEEDYLMQDVFQKLEPLPNLIVAVETNNLEDAYLEIVKQDQNDSVNQEERLQTLKEKVELYARTEGEPSRFSQAFAMCVRRTKTFGREPRQIFLIFLPFFNIAVMCLAMSALMMMVAKGSGLKDSIIQQAILFMVSFSFPFMLNYGFCASAGIYCLIPVAERENETRSILHASGMSTLAYWSGLFLADMIIYTGLVCLFAGFVYWRELFAFYDFFGEFIGETMIFGFSLINFVYMLSHMFSNQNTAIRWIMPILILVGTILPSVFAMSLAGSGSQSASGKIPLLLCFFCSPIATYYYVTYNILYKGFKAHLSGAASQFMQAWNDEHEGNELSEDLLNAENIQLATGFELTPKLIAMTMLTQGLIYFSLVVWTDYRKVNASRKKDGMDFKSAQNRQMAQNSDDFISADDVNRHKVEVQEDYGNVENWQIKAEELHKVYKSRKGNVYAVRGNTFGVKQGKITGLLGPNGAGKSTTFKMLALQHARTYGNIRLMNDPIQNLNLFKQGYQIGLCAQYNSGYDRLTVQENLELIARIKGINPMYVKHNIGLLLETLELQDFKNVRAQNLSGGNQRKLSVAMTLLLRPKVEFMDEPTTGVDPVSRRALFDMIKLLEKSAILLTTHRMDEAELLCDEIAIMINGQFACFGSPNYLLHEYGRGYQFTVFLDPSQSQCVEDVDHQLTRFKLQFERTTANNASSDPEHQHQQDDQGNLRVIYKAIGLEPNQFMIDENDEHDQQESSSNQTAPLKLSVLFKALTEMKANKVIANYTVSRGTLEQVFIRFAQMQQKTQQELEELAMENRGLTSSQRESFAAARRRSGNSVQAGEMENNNNGVNYVSNMTRSSSSSSVAKKNEERSGSITSARSSATSKGSRRVSKKKKKTATYLSIIEQQENENNADDNTMLRGNSKNSNGLGQNYGTSINDVNGSMQEEEEP